MTSLDNDALGRTVEMDTDGVTDTYYVGGTFIFSFPTGTAQDTAYLAIAKQGMMKRLNDQALDFARTHYDIDTKMTLMVLYTIAKENSLTNRAAYIRQALTWANSLTSYSVSVAATILADTDPAVIAAMIWDFNTCGIDPGITPGAAVQIPN